MLPTPRGAIRIFRFLGVNVYVHWSWLVVAVFLVERTKNYDNKAWAWGEYLALFAIVLMHEFGHALACRSVGGMADQIVLWPLGGVAYVNPPMRPGAFLWSIAAGPLVNLLLVPVTVILCTQTLHHATLAQLFQASGDDKLLHALLASLNDREQFALSMLAINTGLLVFNMLPIYPLDGGQILQSLLWFFVGFARSLSIVAWIGIGAAALGGLLAVTYRDWWLVIMAVFVGMRAWNGIQVARRVAEAQAEARARAEAQAQAAAGPTWPPQQ